MKVKQYFNESPFFAKIVTVDIPDPVYDESCVDLTSWSPTINEVHNSKLGSASKGVYDFPDGKIDPSAPDITFLRSNSADITEIDERLEQLKAQEKSIKDDIAQKAEELVLEESLKNSENNSPSAAE